MEREHDEKLDQSEQDHDERSERQGRPRFRAVEELIKLRTESQITIEATVDTGLEFMAIEECREKFGNNFEVMKERGSILFNIDKSKYSQVKQLRSVDNLYLVLSYNPHLGLQGTNNAEDVAIAKKQAHTPDWDFWLKVWQELSGFEGIVKPTPEQYAVANERATKDKEAEKLRQAERQIKYKERQERNAEKKAKRKAKADLLRAQRHAAQKVDAENKTEYAEPSSNEEGADKKSEKSASDEDKPVSNVEANAQAETPIEDGDGTEETVTASVETVEEAADSDDEIKSLPDYERDIEREIDANVPPAERVMRFRATCFRVGKHCFGSMEVAREFGGELQEKFNWVVDLVNFNAEVVLFLLKDTAQVSIALTKRSLHRRNISYFGPTTLRSTVCHNLLRLADIKPGDLVLDPMAGGGSIPIEGAMSFPGTFYIGGDNHIKAVSRFYSNVRVLQEEVGKGLHTGAVRWDAKRLPLNEASVDVIVTDMPFGVRMGSKTSNRNLYCKALLEMARVIRPGSGRAVFLTQDRKSFSVAVSGTMGLWWQTKVMSVNMGGLDAAVFTLRRTAKERPDEADLAAAAQREKEYSAWRDRDAGHGHGHGHGQGYGRGRGRGQGPRGRGGRGGGRPYPRTNRQYPSSGGGNWRDKGAAKADGN